mmetsp:Transcript_21953/g.61373  ORF Transcript_21953/g.61373 Transcript_21953/m.61373 type:complete len:256 (+) Transcript_21953:681-1448(+)
MACTASGPPCSRAPAGDLRRFPWSDHEGRRGERAHRERRTFVFPHPRRGRRTDLHGVAAIAAIRVRRLALGGGPRKRHQLLRQRACAPTRSFGACVHPLGTARAAAHPLRESRTLGHAAIVLRGESSHGQPQAAQYCQGLKVPHFSRRPPRMPRAGTRCGALCVWRSCRRRSVPLARRRRRCFQDVGHASSKCVLGRADHATGGACRQWLAEARSDALAAALSGGTGGCGVEAGQGVARRGGVCPFRGPHSSAGP